MSITHFGPKRSRISNQVDQQPTATCRVLFSGCQDSVTDARLQETPACEHGVSHRGTLNARDEDTHLTEEARHLSRGAASASPRFRRRESDGKFDLGEIRKGSTTVHRGVHGVHERLRRCRERKAAPPVARDGVRRTGMRKAMKHVSRHGGVERPALLWHGDVNLPRNLGEHPVEVKRRHERDIPRAARVQIRRRDINRRTPRLCCALDFVMTPRTHKVEPPVIPARFSRYATAHRGVDSASRFAVAAWQRARTIHVRAVDRAWRAVRGSPALLSD